MTFVLLKLWHSPAPTAWRYGKYRPKFFSVYSIIKNSRLNKFHPRGASVNMLPMINVSERLQPCFSNQRYKLWHSYRRLFTLHSASIPTSIYKKLTSNHGFYQVQKKRQPISQTTRSNKSLARESRILQPWREAHPASQSDYCFRVN